MSSWKTTRHTRQLSHPHGKYFKKRACIYLLSFTGIRKIKNIFNFINQDRPIMYFIDNLILKINFSSSGLKIKKTVKTVELITGYYVTNKTSFISLNVVNYNNYISFRYGFSSFIKIKQWNIKFIPW